MTALLKVESVRVEFGQLCAVDDVSFELEGGQLLGLVGPNGAGKTTLLRVLAGLHAPTHGSASVLGKPVLGNHEVVRHHIGFAPDSPPAYEELTVSQFLTFIAQAYQLDPQESQERVDFWLEHLWLNDKRDAKVKELSRGMRQRLTLARTFIPRPHAILLDEPLSGLDPAGRVELRRVLGMLRDQGCAMVVSSHILADLEEVSTHIGILDNGRMVRFSAAQDIHHHEHARMRYEVNVAGDVAACRQQLLTMTDVADVEAQGLALVFTFHADPTAAANLLARLVENKVAVCAFHPLRQTLEQAYLSAGLKQVD